MTRNKALVSVIVPVYGTEEYLPECIDPIMRQTYPHIQLILVDDQSPDRCPEICDDYAQKDSRIIVIHQDNKGVSGARNTGMRCATGDYIMFVDSDDELYPDAVDILLRDAVEYGADIVSATKKVVDESGTTISVYDDGVRTVFRDAEPLLLSLQGNRNTNSACAKLFRTAFIQDIYYEEGKDINEDGFFLFQCYMKKPILVQCDVAIYQYNVRQGTNSRRSFSDKYLSILYFCEKKKELVLAHYPQYEDQVRNMEVRTALQFLQVLCRSKDKQYKSLQKKCVRTVRRLYRYHISINAHHKKLARIVALGLYPVYKMIVCFKY